MPFNGPRYFLATGELSRYGLSCGYIELHERADGRPTVSMWQEHGAYHVRVNDAQTSAILSWESFASDELTKARKALRAALKIR